MRPGFRNRFKGDPQQGTLFSAKAAELDPTGKRYESVRGFTPERQRAVGEAMGEVGFVEGGQRFSDDDVATPAIMNKSEFANSLLNDAQKRDWHEGEARMRESLSRSTVPLEDISSVKKFAVAPKLGMNGVWMPKDETLLFGRSSAEVDQHRAGFGTGNPTPEVQRLNAGQTVIHEMGHVVDPAIAPLRGKRNAVRIASGENPVAGYEDPPATGHLEQNADDYAEKHFRPDPRGGRRQQFAVEAGMYPGAAPSDIPMAAHLEGYEKWGARSDAAVSDMEPRWAAAEKRGEQYPKTPDQESYARRLKRIRPEQLDFQSHLTREADI